MFIPLLNQGDYMNMPESNSNYNLFRHCVIFFILLLVSSCGESGRSTDNEQERLIDLPAKADILFTSNRDTGSRTKEIYAMDSSGNNITRITFTQMHHRILGISPSKEHLVVTRIDEDTEAPSGLGDEDRTNLWILDLVTKTETRLTDNNNTAEGDSFSPDGEWIVFFMVVTGESQSDIYKIRTNGSDLTRLTFTANVAEGDPAWSHDGTQIVFVSYSAGTPRFVIKGMDADGANVHTIYDGNDTISTPYFPPGAYDPSCSPDGQWVVFEKPVSFNGENGNAGIWHLFKIHPDGTGLVNLSEAGAHTDMAEYLPSYSPAVDSIIFSARYGSSDPAGVQIDVFEMDINGSSVQQITQNSSYDDFAIWIR